MNDPDMSKAYRFAANARKHTEANNQALSEKFKTILALEKPTFRQLCDVWNSESRRRYALLSQDERKRQTMSESDIPIIVLEEIWDAHPNFLPHSKLEPVIATPEMLAKLRAAIENE